MFDGDRDSQCRRPEHRAKEGKVVCFFKAASKFKTRYATFRFEEAALIDDGTMWATSFAITALSEADERKISKLVKKAVG